MPGGKGWTGGGGSPTEQVNVCDHTGQPPPNRHTDRQTENIPFPQTTYVGGKT